jgi:hypothetical protein
MRYKIQAAPTPEQEALLKQQLPEWYLEHGGEPLNDDANKLLTTGWIATAEEALEMFKGICEPPQT